MELSIWLMALSCYMGCGLVWVLWQSSSRIFRRTVELSREFHHPWIPPVALIIGILVWPLGLLGTVMLDAINSRKEKKE
jgi:hypothetical protein